MQPRRAVHLVDNLQLTPPRLLENGEQRLVAEGGHARTHVSRRREFHVPFPCVSLDIEAFATAATLHTAVRVHVCMRVRRTFAYTLNVTTPPTAFTE